MSYWDNYNFKQDADKITIPYYGDFNKYLNDLHTITAYVVIVRRAYAESEFSATMNYVKFCEIITKVKEIEYREQKIDSILR